MGKKAASFLIIFFAVLSFTYSKTINYGLGTGIAISTGDFGKYYGPLGPLGSGKILYNIYNQIDIVALIDLFYLPANNHEGRLIRFSPCVSTRYTLPSRNNFGLFGEAGIGIAYDNAHYRFSESGTSLSLRIGVGLSYRKIEFTAGFQVASQDDDPANAIIFAVFYFFNK